MVAATAVLIDFSPGLREGSKLMILIFGIHPSAVALSVSIAFAERFLVRDGVLDDEGDDEDIAGQISEWN